MKKSNTRDLTIYVLVFLLMFFTAYNLQTGKQEDNPDYSQIRTYFLQEQVEYFTLKDNTLTLTLRGEGEESTRLIYQLADASVFYTDMRELIDQQYLAGILKYDYVPGVESSWWYNLLPTFVTLIIAGGFLFFVYRQRSNSANGGGGRAPAGGLRTPQTPLFRRF